MPRRVIAITGSERSEFKQQVHQLALTSDEATRYADAVQPYWLSLRQPRDGELQWTLFDYFPAAHYRRALRDTELEPDGGYDTQHSGTRPATVYYWLNPETGAALYHTGVNDEETIPFFPDDTTARDYLAKRAATGDKAPYKGLSLYKARTRKVGDAVDVLTDQAGFDDFIPDGGLQIADPLDTVWFWYNPSLDSIMQEEVASYDVRGVFATEDDAYRFLDWYVEQYGVVDTSHLELYSAELKLAGYGRKFLDEESDRSDEPPEQIDFDAFRQKHADTGDEGDAV